MNEKWRTFAALATPDGRPGLGRVLLAGSSALVLAVAGSVALVSLAVLLAALSAIYLIVTRVLCIELKLDPRAFWEQAAAAYQN